MPRRDRTGERTVYTHAFLRKAARHLLEQGVANREGSFYNFLSSNLCAAFLIEAFLNHLGAIKIPDWEASYDRLEPKEKLKALAKAVNCSIDYQGATYQAFTDLFAFRTALVHGRTAFLEGSWPAQAEVQGATPLQTDWERLCRPTQATRLLDEAEKLVRSLHEAAGFKEDPFATLSGGFSRGALPN